MSKTKIDLKNELICAIMELTEEECKEILDKLRRKDCEQRRVQ